MGTLGLAFRGVRGPGACAAARTHLTAEHRGARLPFTSQVVQGTAESAAGAAGGGGS